MRHYRRPDDAGHEQQALLAGQAGNKAGRDSRRRPADHGEVVHEAKEDDAEQGGDRELEFPVAALLERQDPEGDHRRDQARRQQRDAEEQVQPDRRADEFRQIGRHGDQLGLQPQAKGDRARQVVAA